MRTVATFRSSAFNVSEVQPHFINPGCFGDDLAKWMITRLRARGIHTDDEPGQEDFGWYFDFTVPAGEHTCVLSFRPDEPEGAWVLWLERARGLVVSLLGGRKRGIDDSAVRAIHETLTGTTEVRDLRWHEKGTFDAGREEDGSGDPAGGPGT